MTIHAAVGASAPSALGSAGGSPVAGPRELLHFGQPNIAAGDNATVALSTPVQIPFCGVAAVTAGVAAIRPGSLVGLSVNLSAAAAGSSAIFGVYKNGVIFHAAAIVTLAAADTLEYIAFAAGTYPYAAGDVIDVRVRTGTGWSATTVDAAVLVEVESLT
jgi:hypothetical protein